MPKIFRSSILVASMACTMPAFAAPDATNTGKDATNTGKNKAETPTADNSKSSKSDVQLTAEIRRAVMKDKALSTNAHNCKIIVEAGSVTLKGPVKSVDEKQKIGEAATQVVGAGHVKNQLEVAP